MLFDIMASDFIHGSFDNRLFSIQEAKPDSPGFPKQFEHDLDIDDKAYKTKIVCLDVLMNVVLSFSLLLTSFDCLIETESSSHSWR